MSGIRHVGTAALRTTLLPGDDLFTEGFFHLPDDLPGLAIGDLHRFRGVSDRTTLIDQCEKTAGSGSELSFVSPHYDLYRDFHTFIVAHLF